MDILGVHICVFVHVYLYIHACVHVRVSEYICRHVNAPIYVGVGRLCMYMCADFEILKQKKSCSRAG